MTDHTRVELGQHHEVSARRTRLLNVLKQPATSWQSCHTAGQLQDALPDDYPKGRRGAGRRKLLRDLEALKDADFIVIDKRSQQDVRYRRAADPIVEDSLIAEAELNRIRKEITRAARHQQLGATLQRLTHTDGTGLANKSIIDFVPDHLQLKEVALSEEILDKVLQALFGRCPLTARYRKRSGKMSGGELHPQAFVQRGPIPYLLAVKQGEGNLIKHFPLHRMTSVALLSNKPAIQVEEFDLQAHIGAGFVDFSQGEQGKVSFKARGYIIDILGHCPLSDDQQITTDLTDDSFDAVVSATVPLTGAFYRWLLAAGSNVEVLEPLELRQRFQAEMQKCADIYSSTLIGPG
ncbi:helix-turn-helix transcriptional regulator [Spiribacter salilacus]|uniref:helix-turn-helix transcriptional regulator n=1 Tax=Spiribacter salilacus TaxID=2664894 RepID=UPI00129AD2A4